jgi:hypothetical protein
VRIATVCESGSVPSHLIPTDIEALHVLVAAARVERDAEIADRDHALLQIAPHARQNSSDQSCVVKRPQNPAFPSRSAEFLSLEAISSCER